MAYISGECQCTSFNSIPYLTQSSELVWLCDIYIAVNCRIIVYRVLDNPILCRFTN